MSKDFNILLIYPNTQMATLVPLSISSLSACLKERGIPVELFDTTYYKTEEKSFEERKVELLQLKPFNWEERGISYKKTDIYEDLKTMVRKYKPDIIGITLVEDTFDLGMSLLEAIEDYDVPVVAGGVYVTVCPEDVISNKNVDILCIGEGEEALVELCESIAENRDYFDIQNLWIKRHDRVIKNPCRLLKNLDEVPFVDYDIFGKERLYRPMHGKIYTMIHVELDRGCPYNCTYCEAPRLKEIFHNAGSGTYYRSKTNERAIAEIKHLVEKYKPDFVNFNSETFLAKPINKFKDFAEKYKKIGLPFWCQSRPETVTEEKIKILKDMNCQNLQFGIEHGNEKFREKVLRRKCTNERMLEAFKIVEKYEIDYTVNNIIGFPDETRELVFDTINFNRKIKPVTINCYMFTPYKGTRLYDYCIKKGYLKKGDKVHQAIDGAPLNMDSISYQELKGLQRTFSLYVRFPEDMYESIRIAEHNSDKGNRMFQKLKKLYYEKY